MEGRKSKKYFQMTFWVDDEHPENGIHTNIETDGFSNVEILGQLEYVKADVVAKMQLEHKKSLERVSFTLAGDKVIAAMNKDTPKTL